MPVEIHILIDCEHHDEIMAATDLCKEHGLNAAAGALVAYTEANQRRVGRLWIDSNAIHIAGTFGMEKACGTNDIPADKSIVLRAKEALPILEEGLERLVTVDDGSPVLALYSYDNLVGVVSRYIAFCRRYPEAWVNLYNG